MMPGTMGSRDGEGQAVVTAGSRGSYAPGARVLVRDEEWLVRSAVQTAHDGCMIKVVGASEFVQDCEATFFDRLESVEVLRPENTVLVADDTPRFRRSRLYLEALLRRTPLPRGERGLALADSFLLDPKTYQQRPAERALSGLRPRLLIADVVGLGKTLEIGLILAELARRGRGDRILVVTPQQVLEQFQHELWTRFSLPLVRLDSVGIERIQREIPAGRNPFTYFKRVIVSVDTVKNVGMYGHHLENIVWDAVVIDESHNLIGSASLRNRLARLLASRTDALLLASATPHNGDKKSFGELIRLLDPAAIADVEHYSDADISHLYVRRTKIDKEVRDEISGDWADRGPSVPLRCPATPAEEKIFAEFVRVWLPPGDAGTADPVVRPQVASIVSRERRLFPYTLLKAFLSSHHALAQTVDTRLGSAGCTDPAERAALERLRTLAAAMTDTDSAKLSALLRELRGIGVGPGSDVRVVVFSERIPTVKWLAEVVPAALGFTGRAARDAVAIMHGGLTDTEQQKIVEEFSQGDIPVRMLFTGDVASEGVNLHRACHQLVHYDLPWSLIRIEQRNGRIDRYGQRLQPQFRALILTSAVDGAKDDTTVAEKVLAREAEAHRSLGSAGAVTGEYLADREERRLVQDLLAGRTVEESLSLDVGPERDVLADLLAGVGATSVAAQPRRAALPTVFASTEQFVQEALREVFGSPEDALALRREDGLIAFDAPPDLERRMSDLPRSYLADQRVDGRLRLKLTFDRELAGRALDEARRSRKSSWPAIAYVSDIHPVVDWLIDKVLVRLGRQQAPVLLADVAGPVFCIQGIYCNRMGQPTVVEWMAVRGLPDMPDVGPLAEVLARAGVNAAMTNPASGVDLGRLQGLVPAAVDAARRHLAARRDAWDATTAEPLRVHRARLEHWRQQSLLPETAAASQRASRMRRVDDTMREQNDLVARLETTGEPLLRLLAVLESAA